MYLSTLLINVGDHPDRPRPGRSWLRNVYRVHQRLCMAFPSEERKQSDKDFLKPYKPEDFGYHQVHTPRRKDAGFLFRIDPIPGGRAVILVQSAVEPDWDFAFHNAMFLLSAPPDIKPFDPQFSIGQKLRFRLTANPTKKIDTKSGPDGKKRNGRRVPVRPENFLGWLVQKSIQSGFSIMSDNIIIQRSYIFFHKPNTQQENYLSEISPGKGDYQARLRLVRYDGVLTIDDINLFHLAIERGIGSGKAFGFGLLSLAQMQCGTL